MNRKTLDLYTKAYKAWHGAQGAPEISVEELKDLLDNEESVYILDVREPWEYERCRISGSHLIPLGELLNRLDELDKSQPIVVQCHSGGRSARAVQILRKAGFEHAVNLAGGIEAWTDRIDPSLPKY